MKSIATQPKKINPMLRPMILAAIVGLSVNAARATDTLLPQEGASSAASAATTRTSALQLMKGPAFPPTDVNLFSPETYSEATPTEPAPAPDTPMTEKQLRAQVSKFSGKAGLKVMDDPTLRDKILDVRLLAALATLPGTPLTGAIEAFKTDTFSSVEFGQPPAGEDAIGQVVDDGTGHRKVIVNEKYQHEDIRLLSVTLGHESLHQGSSNSNRVELMNIALESLTYAQSVKKNPSLASQGTELTRRQNTRLMALINSRDENGQIHLLSARPDDPEYTVYPGTDNPDPLRYFGQRFVETGLGEDTPGNSVLLSAIKIVTKNSKLTSADFDDATLDLLDQNIKLFVPPQWIRIAQALKLDTSPD
jgi:hypothetical protein